MSFIVNILFPRLCYGCFRFGSYICPDCQNSLTIGRLSHTRFKSIEAHLPVFSDPIVKQAIIDLKYHHVTDIAKTLAIISARVIKKNFPLIFQYWHQNNFYLIPVPMHIYRQNWRGFNQSDLIGQHLAKYLNLPFLSNLITKNCPTHSQAKSINKPQRLKNLSSAFSLDISKNIPSNIIIFDDILTTGATCLSLARLFPPNTNIWILSLI